MLNPNDEDIAAMMEKGRDFIDAFSGTGRSGIGRSGTGRSPREECLDLAVDCNHLGCVGENRALASNFIGRVRG